MNSWKEAESYRLSRLSILDDISIAWIAGLLEGEGSFILRPSGQRCVQMGTTDLWVIKRLASLTGGPIYGPNRYMYTWRLSGKPSLKLVELIKPLMSDRRKLQISIMQQALPCEDST